MEQQDGHIYSNNSTGSGNSTYNSGDYNVYNAGANTSGAYNTGAGGTGFNGNNGYGGNGYSGNGYGQNNYGQTTHTAMDVQSLYQSAVGRAFVYLFAALVVTAVAAYTTSDLLLAWFLANPFLILGLFVAEIAIVIASNIALKKDNVVLSAVLFTVYSFINGATIGVVCMTYTQSSVVQAFAITAVLFGIMAAYGLITKKDLSSWGSLLFMGLIGVLIASVVNIFLKNSFLELGLAIVCVLVFTGLTAYDVQKIKARATQGGNVTSLALYGAFQLYLDFINIFLRILQLLGKRR